MGKVSKKTKIIKCTENNRKYYAVLVDCIQYPCSKTRSGKLMKRQTHSLFRTGSSYGCTEGCPTEIKQSATLLPPQVGQMAPYGGGQSLILKIIGEIKPTEPSLKYENVTFRTYENIKSWENFSKCLF